MSEFRGNADEKLEVDAGHGAGQHREVVLVEKVVDGEFQLDVHRFEKQPFLQRDVAHEILGQVSGERVVVARHGEAFRIVGPLVEEAPCFPREPPRERGGMLRHVGKLLAHRLVGGRHLLALVDGGCPRVGAVQVDEPVLGGLHGEVRFQLDAVGVHLLHVARREEAFGRRQPDDPVLDVGVEPRGAAAQLVDLLFAHVETHSGIVGEAVLVLQVGVAARQEIEVVQRREAVVARDGGFDHHVALAREQPVDEECRDERRPLVARHLLAQDERQTQRFDRLPLGGNGAGELDTPLVVPDDGLVPVLKDDVLVLAAHQMLVGRHVGGEEPSLVRRVFALRLPVERVHPAAGTGHRSPVVRRHLAAVVVGHPRVDVAAFHAELPPLPEVIPREDAPEGLFALAVLEVGGVAVVGREHRKLAVGVDIPGVQTQPVAFARVVVHLLQEVQVLERAAAVPLFRVILPDDVVVVIVDVYLLVVVGVLVVVGRRGVDRAGRDVPAVAAIGEAGELVEGAERPDALHVLGVESLAGMGRGAEPDKAAQTAARLVHRRGAVQQRRLVDEVGRDGREIGHAQHGVVDAHAVPRHLRVARGGPAKGHGGERGAAVALDEHRRVERQDVGHRQRDVLLQRERVELRLLHADLLHRASAPHRNLADLVDALRDSLRRQHGRAGEQQQKGYVFRIGHRLSILSITVPVGVFRGGYRYGRPARVEAVLLQQPGVFLLEREFQMNNLLPLDEPPDPFKVAERHAERVETAGPAVERGVFRGFLVHHSRGALHLVHDSAEIVALRNLDEYMHVVEKGIGGVYAAALPRKNPLHAVEHHRFARRRDGHPTPFCDEDEMV